MSYSMMGAVGADSFKLVNGIAKPVDFEALANFKSFQSELNRFGQGTVTVDGAIGPATARIYNKVTKTSLTPAQIAAALPGITTVLKALAAAASLPAAKPLPASKPVKQSNGTVAETALPPPTPETLFSSAVDFIASPFGIAAGVGAIGLLLFLGKKKSRATAPAAAVPAIPKVA